MTYTAKVYGRAWAGYMATTEYTFDHAPTKEDIEKKAGDFESLHSAQVTLTQTKRYQAAQLRW